MKIKTGLVASIPERRGMHDNRLNKTRADVAVYIIQHTPSFSVEESHYSIKYNINKKYLSSLMSIPIMNA